MVESEAKELSEEVMLGAVMEAHRSFQPVIDAIIQLAEHCAKDPLPLTDPSEASKTVAEKQGREAGKLVDGLRRDPEAGPPGQDRRREDRGEEAVRRR